MCVLRSRSGIVTHISENRWVWGASTLFLTNKFFLQQSNDAKFCISVYEGWCFSTSRRITPQSTKVDTFNFQPTKSSCCWTTVVWIWQKVSSISTKGGSRAWRRGCLTPASNLPSSPCVAENVIVCLFSPDHDKATQRRGPFLRLAAPVLQLAGHSDQRRKCRARQHLARVKTKKDNVVLILWNKSSQSSKWHCKMICSCKTLRHLREKYTQMSSMNVWPAEQLYITYSGPHPHRKQCAAALEVVFYPPWLTLNIKKVHTVWQWRGKFPWIIQFG